MNKKINSSSAPDPVGSYPHARKVGNLLFLSGVGPRKPGTKVIPGVMVDGQGNPLGHDIEIQCHSVFKNVSRPTTLKLNSPILQRKEGYREVLRTWLMFELAAKLIWRGGEDVYGAGKKDIATLYEYWLFFKLLGLFQELFEIDPKDVSELIKPSKDGLNLQIKQGKFTALKGVFETDTRKLNIQFIKLHLNFIKLN